MFNFNYRNYIKQTYTNMEINLLDELCFFYAKFINLLIKIKQ